MPFDVISAKISGSPNANFWSKTYEASPEDRKILKEKGKLFAVISIRSSNGVMDSNDQLSFELGNQNWGMANVIFERLSSIYYQNDTTALNSLKLAHRSILKNFASLWDSLEISLLAVVGDNLYFCTSGGAKAAILRGGSLTNILDTKNDTTLSASGKAKLNDIFLIGSNAFFSGFSYQQVVHALSLGNLHTSAQNLVSNEKFQSNQSATACLFVQFDSPKNKDRLIINQAEKSRTNLKIPDLKNKLVGLINLPFGKKLYLREEHDPKIKKRRKVLVSVGSILLILLGVSIIFGIRQAKTNEYKEQYEETLNQAEHELSEAENIYPISKDRSRELFIASKNKADELLGRGVEDSRLTDLVSKISEKRGSILGEYEVQSQLFVDLSLLSSGFSGRFIASSQDELYVLDSQNEKLVSIAINTKRSEVVAGPSQIDNPKGLAVYSGTVYLLTADGIYEIDGGKEKVIDKSWEGEVLLYSFADNMYVLDKTASQIYRYSSSESGFSSQNAWLTPGLTVDLTRSKQMVIDGSIWILSEDGEIDRFSLGNKVAFKISGVYPEINKIDAIYTNDSLEYLYLLYKEGKRVVVLTKDGVYKAQYKSDQISETQNLIVSEEEKKILLLTGEKLLEIEIKH